VDETGKEKENGDEDEATQRNATIGAAIITKRRKREERGIQGVPSPADRGGGNKIRAVIAKIQTSCKNIVQDLRHFLPLLKALLLFSLLIYRLLAMKNRHLG